MCAIKSALPHLFARATEMIADAELIDLIVRVSWIFLGQLKTPFMSDHDCLD